MPITAHNLVATAANESIVVALPPEGIDAAKIAEDRDTVMTRSPSPDGMVDHEDHPNQDGGAYQELEIRAVPTPCGDQAKRRPRSAKFKAFKSFTGGSGRTAAAAAAIDPSRSWDSDPADVARLIEEDDDNASVSSKHSSASSNVSSKFGDVASLRGKMHPKWVPSSTSRQARRLKKTSGLFSSFSRKKNGKNGHHGDNHSIHLVGHLSTPLEEEDAPLDPNSDHNAALTEVLKANSHDGLNSAADMARLLNENPYDDDHYDDSRSGGGEGGAARAARRPLMNRQSSSNLSSFTSFGSSHDPRSDDELDVEEPLDKAARVDSRTLLERLGSSPTTRELANVAAVRAEEYIEECLSADVSSSSTPVLDRVGWESIPQYAKADLLVGRHLGKGTFSDAFEVIASVAEKEDNAPTLESLGEDGADLDRMIEKRFSSKPVQAKLRAAPLPRVNSLNWDAEEEEEGTDGDEEMGSDSKFSQDSLDAQIDAMFGVAPAKNDAPRPEEAPRDDLGKEAEALFHTSNPDILRDEDAEQLRRDEPPPQAKVFPSQRRQQVRRGSGRLDLKNGVGASICLGTHAQQRQSAEGTAGTLKMVLAMKCLRPQIRSDAEQFLIGVEDLVHETAMLASLDHPNIVKLHGRAGGCAGDAFRLSDGYFILLDHLTETLEDRIDQWKRNRDRKSAPSLCQVRAACSIADAMSYLHSRNIVFRDLKPANVGFDASGTLKLFDFGFAIGIDEPPHRDDDDDSVGSDSDDGLLYDRCGTPRYMAPEVGLESGYGLPADVYSFGILLWEICALKKPFGNVRSADEFHRTVFEKGSRPKPGRQWPKVLTETMTGCWSTFPTERPEMSHVKSMLAAHALELSARRGGGGGGERNFRKSSVLRRFTG